LHYNMTDLSGERFGRLVVTDQWEHRKGRVAWWCICDCGNKVLVTARQLRNGTTKSCGCLLEEKRGKATIKENKYEVYGDYAIGYTAKGEKYIVETADLSILKEYCWSVSKKGYLTARKRGKGNEWLYLHQALIKYDKNKFVVDHIDGDPMNNRRSNLRVCTQQQNSFNTGLNKNNTSGYTGVYFCNTKKKWRAQIRINYRNISLGYYEILADAISAREKAERKYFGEFSRKESAI